MSTSHQKLGLVYAAGKGLNSIVKRLLSQGESINENQEGFTPFLAACAGGHHSTVSLLVELKADISIRNSDGETGLVCAAKKGHAHIVEYLLKVVDPKRSLDVKDREGNTALVFAITENHLNIVNLLIAAGADVNSCDIDNTTILMYACVSGNLQGVQRLLESKANTDAIDTHGNTALMYAAKSKSLAIVQLLIESNANATLRNFEGQSILDFSNEEISNYLVSTGKVNSILSKDWHTVSTCTSKAVEPPNPIGKLPIAISSSAKQQTLPIPPPPRGKSTNQQAQIPTEANKENKVDTNATPATVSQAINKNSSNVSKTSTENPSVDFNVYKKMISQGLPEPMIRKRMEIDGLKAAEIKEFFSNYAKSSNSQQQPISTPTKVFNPPKKLADPVIDPKTVDDEFLDRRFDVFKTMQRILVPEAQVRQRMETEGCSKAKIDRFMAMFPRNQSDSAEEMQQLNQPVALTLETDPEFAHQKFDSYKKMKKVMIPENQIRGKMAADGFPVAVIDKFFQKYPPASHLQSTTPSTSVVAAPARTAATTTAASINVESPPTPAPSPAVESHVPTQKTTVVQSESRCKSQVNYSDPSFDGYRKMKKVMIPDQQVKAKMKLDGHSDAVVEGFFKSLGSALVVEAPQHEPIAPQVLNKKVSWDVSDERVVDGDQARAQLVLPPPPPPVQKPAQKSSQAVVASSPTTTVESSQVAGREPVPQSNASHRSPEAPKPKPANVMTQPAPESSPVAVVIKSPIPSSIQVSTVKLDGTPSDKSKPSPIAPAASQTNHDGLTTASSLPMSSALTISDPIFKPYHKMLNIGMLTGQVLGRMKLDSLPESHTEFFFADAGVNAIIKQSLESSQSNTALTLTASGGNRSRGNSSEVIAIDDKSKKDIEILFGKKEEDVISNWPKDFQELVKSNTSKDIQPSEALSVSPTSSTTANTNIVATTANSAALTTNTTATIPPISSVTITSAPNSATVASSIPTTNLVITTTNRTYFDSPSSPDSIGTASTACLTVSPSSPFTDCSNISAISAGSAVGPPQESIFRDNDDEHTLYHNILAMIDAKCASNSNEVVAQRDSSAKSQLSDSPSTSDGSSYMYAASLEKKMSSQQSQGKMVQVMAFLQSLGPNKADLYISVLEEMIRNLKEELELENKKRQRTEFILRELEDLLLKSNLEISSKNAAIAKANVAKTKRSFIPHFTKPSKTAEKSKSDASSKKAKAAAEAKKAAEKERKAKAKKEREMRRQAQKINQDTSVMAPVEGEEVDAHCACRLS